MKWKGRLEKKDASKEKDDCLQVHSHHLREDDEDDEEKDDEDLSLLVKNVRRMYNKAKSNNRRPWQGKEEKKSFASIAGSRDTLLRNAQKPKTNHLP